MTQHLYLLSAAPGDSNGDGIFNSADLVSVFVLGEYEDGIAANSDWVDGDWDLDGDFTSSDFVVAFQAGFYSTDARPAPVPEPSAGFGILLAALGWLTRRNLTLVELKPAIQSGVHGAA